MMAANFDPYDKNSWYFGPMTRPDATSLLMAESETGVFLVRNSQTIQGDLVLCVREDSKVSHYIINRLQQGDQTRFRIGDQMFPDVPALLSFYKLHYLDTTALIRPAAKKFEKVKAKFDFEGSGDSDDLPFKRGDILIVLSKDEEQWWTAKNAMGETGSIPVPYVELVDESLNVSDSQSVTQNNSPQSSPPPSQTISKQPPEYIRPPNANPTKTPHTRKLPALAKVVQSRVPNAYDKTALKLQIGETIKVTKTNINGQWEGELNGKMGHFPFTHVEFIDSENGDEDEAA